MTGEQEVAAAMREAIIEAALNERVDGGVSEEDRAYNEAINHVVEAIRALPPPEAKPYPRDVALAKAREALKRLSVERNILWEPNKEQAARWRIHVNKMTGIAKEALSVIEAVLNGHSP